MANKAIDFFPPSVTQAILPFFQAGIVLDGLEKSYSKTGPNKRKNSSVGEFPAKDSGPGAPSQEGENQERLFPRIGVKSKKIVQLPGASAVSKAK